MCIGQLCFTYAVVAGDNILSRVNLYSCQDGIYKISNLKREVRMSIKSKKTSSKLEIEDIYKI